MKKLLENKGILTLVLVLGIFFFIKDIYRWEIYDYWKKYMNIFQVWRNLFIQMPSIDSFYLYSYNNYKVEYNPDTLEHKIVVQFYRKPVFLVGKHQSDIINIWLNKEWIYKLYYTTSNGEEVYLKDIKYSKEMDNVCTIN